MLTKIFLFLLVYGVALVLFLLTYDAKSENFTVKNIVSMAHIGLIFFLVGVPWMVVFALWETREKKLFEERKDELREK